MQGGIVERGKPLFWEWRNGKAVRDAKWKIVAHGKEAAWELYNMNEDPTESNNLAKSNPEIVTYMNGFFESWQRENEQWN